MKRHWFKELSHVQQRAYLKAHPNSKLKATAAIPRVSPANSGHIKRLTKAIRRTGLAPKIDKVVHQAVDIGVSYGLSGAGLGNIDAVRDHRLPVPIPKLTEKPQHTRPVKIGGNRKLRSTAPVTRLSQSERIAESKRRAKPRRP